MPAERPYWPQAMRQSTAAAYLDLSERRFAEEVRSGRLPASFSLGGAPHWLRPALDEAISVMAAGPADDWRAFQPGLQRHHAVEAPSTVTSEEPDVYDVVTLAEKWGCGTDTVRSLIKSGDLPAFKLGGKLLRVRAADVAAYESARRLPDDRTANGRRGVRSAEDQPKDAA